MEQIVLLLRHKRGIRGKREKRGEERSGNKMKSAFKPRATRGEQRSRQERKRTHVDPLTCRRIGGEQGEKGVVDLSLPFLKLDENDLRGKRREAERLADQGVVMADDGAVEDGLETRRPFSTIQDVGLGKLAETVRPGESGMLEETGEKLS
jgi:hypothetical protein